VVLSQMAMTNAPASRRAKAAPWTSRIWRAPASGSTPTSSCSPAITSATVPWAFHTGCGFWVEQSDPRVSNAGPALVICGGPGGYPRTVARCWKDRAIRSIRPPRSAYGRAPRHRRPRSHCSAFHCRHGLAPSGHP